MTDMINILIIVIFSVLVGMGASIIIARRKFSKMVEDAQNWFNYNTGLSMSCERKKELMDLLDKHKP